MAAPNPPESLVLYGDPIFTGETVDPGKKPLASSLGTMDSASSHKLDNIARIEDVLTSMLPPQ